MATNFRIGTIGLYKTYADAVADFNSGINSFIKKFSKYSCSNSLQYATSPYRDNSFTMRNDESVVTAKYVPEVSFTFYAMSEEVFSWFIQLTNTRGFYVRYYDFEIGVDVIRYMYMTEQSKDNIQTSAPDKDNQFGFISNIIGLKITFVSKLAYDSYDDLIAKAHEDSRMLPQVESPDFDISSTKKLDTYDVNGNPISIYAPVTENGATVYKEIVVTDKGEDENNAGQQITAYDSSGSVISVYKKYVYGDYAPQYIQTNVYYPTLAISTDTDGASIYYTTDSVTSSTINNDDITKQLYSTPISLYNYLTSGMTDVTFSAYATKAEMNDSYIAKFEWTPTIGE